MQGSSSRRGFEETFQSSDLRVQELVATQRGPLIDLAWKVPDFDPATRQLVGFELFRDDTSTRPPARRTWNLLVPDTNDALGLEILPHSEYGVQPIWRMASAEPVAVIAFGPPRLTRDLAGPSIVVPPEERIHSLAWLQRAGLITSEEMELAIERLLGANAPPVLASQPTTATAIPVTAASAATSKTRRTLAAYIAAAVILILAAIVGGPFAGRLLFAHPTAVQVVQSPSPTAEQPFQSPTSSPTPTARQLNLQPILIKPADLRPGYVAGQYQPSVLCDPCVPAQYSLTVVLQNKQLYRSIISGASVAPSVGDARSVVRALVNVLSSGRWTHVAGLGDESFTTSVTRGGRSYFYVVWRAGAITEELRLIARQGSLTMQSAIDLAKVQQARTATAVA